MVLLVAGLFWISRITWNEKSSLGLNSAPQRTVSAADDATPDGPTTPSVLAAAAMPRAEERRQAVLVDAVRLVALLDGRPAIGAKLYWFDASARVTRDRVAIAESDSSGVIRASRQELGERALVIRHDEALPHPITRDNLISAEHADVVVHLQRSHSLTIRVCDLAGHPLSDVKVMAGRTAGRQKVAEALLGTEMLPGDDGLGAVWVRETGEDGIVTLLGLPSGLVNLRYEHSCATVHDPRTALTANIPSDREKTVAMAVFYGVALKCTNDVLVYATGMLPSTGGVHPVESGRAYARAKDLISKRFPGANVLVTTPPLDSSNGRMPEELPVRLEVLGRNSGWAVIDAVMRPTNSVAETPFDLRPGSSAVTAKIVFRFSNPDGSSVDYRNAIYRSQPGSKFVQGDLITPGATVEMAAGRYIVIITDRAVRLHAKGTDPRAGGNVFDVVSGEDREVNIQLGRPVHPVSIMLKGPSGPIDRAYLTLSHPSASGRDVDNRYDDVETSDRLFWLPADEDVVIEVHVPGFQKVRHRVPAGAGLATVEARLVHDS